ncbi:MAG TPA: hypothetical protein VJS37_07085 [Terriglobales bacterium]|nr:hypothetical protein [Terriglobales bacterium]
MAALPLIQLDWWKDPKGYHLAGSGRVVVRNGNLRDKLVHCEPLAGSQTLFLIFATEATTPEGVLDFVEKYGPLTIYGNDKGDAVGEVIRRAETMRDTLKWMAAHPQRRMSRETFFGPGIHLHACLEWDRRSRSPEWRFRPTTLADGLWLQFAQSVTRGVQLRTCMHCGDLFEAGLGTGRRLDAKFCSDEHRIAFNSLKRSKER